MRAAISKDIEVVLERYFISLREGINYPFLRLLMEGSQMMRLEYPESAHFYRSRWKDCERGFPYEIKTEGDLAVVGFAEDLGDANLYRRYMRSCKDNYWQQVAVDWNRAWATLNYIRIFLVT